jgi:hypothetical protein
MADYRHKDTDIAIRFGSIDSPGGGAQSEFRQHRSFLREAETFPRDWSRA